MSVWTEKLSQLASLVDPSSECNKFSMSEFEPTPIRAETPSAIEICADDSQSKNDLVTQPTTSGRSEIDLRNSGSEDYGSLGNPDSDRELDSNAVGADVEIVEPTPLSDLTSTDGDDNSDGCSRDAQGKNKDDVELIDVDEGDDDHAEGSKGKVSSTSSVIVGDSSPSLASAATEFDTPPSNGMSAVEDEGNDVKNDKVINGENGGNKDDDNDAEEGMFSPDDQGSNEPTDPRPFAAVEDWRRDLELCNEDDELFQGYNTLQFRARPHRGSSVDSVGASVKVSNQDDVGLDGEGSGLGEPRPSTEWNSEIQDESVTRSIPELSESANHFAFEEVPRDEGNVIEFYFSQSSDANMEAPWEVFLPGSDYRTMGRHADANSKEAEDSLKENKDLGSITRTPKKHSTHVVHPLSASLRLRRELSFSTASEVANSSTVAQCGSPFTPDSLSSSMAGTKDLDDEITELLSEMDSAIEMNGEPAKIGQDDSDYAKDSDGTPSNSVVLPKSDFRNEMLPKEQASIETRNEDGNNPADSVLVDEPEQSASDLKRMIEKQSLNDSYSKICRFVALNEEKVKEATDVTVSELKTESASFQDSCSVKFVSEPTPGKFLFNITDVSSMAGAENLCEEKPHLKRKKESDDDSPVATSKQFKTENSENISPETMPAARTLRYVRYAGSSSDLIPDDVSQKFPSSVFPTQLQPATALEGDEVMDLSPSAKDAPLIAFPSPSTPPDLSSSKTSPTSAVEESSAPLLQAESPAERQGSSDLPSETSGNEQSASGFSPQDQRVARRQQRRTSPYNYDAAVHRVSRKEASIMANRAKWEYWNHASEPRFTPNRNMQPTLMSPTSSPPFGAFATPRSQPSTQSRFSFCHNPDATILQQSSGSRGKFEFPSPPYTSEPTKVIPWYGAVAPFDPSALTKYFMAELCQRAEQGEQLLGAYLLGLRVCCPETFSEKKWNALRCNISRKSSQASVVITKLVPANPPQENDYVRLQLETMRQTKTVTFPVNPIIHPCHMLALVASLTLLLVQWRRPTSAYRGFTHLWRVGTADFLHLATSSLGLDRLHADPNYAWQCFPAKGVCREFGHLACALELDLEVFDIVLEELDRTRRAKERFRPFFEQLARQCDLLDQTTYLYDSPEASWDDQGLDRTDQLATGYCLSPKDVRHLLNEPRARQPQQLEPEERFWGRESRCGHQQRRKARRSAPYPLASHFPAQPPNRHPDHTYDRSPDFSGNVRGAFRLKNNRVRTTHPRSHGTPRPWDTTADGAVRPGLSPRWGFRAGAQRDDGDS